MRDLDVAVVGGGQATRKLTAIVLCGRWMDAVGTMMPRRSIEETVMTHWTPSLAPAVLLLVVVATLAGRPAEAASPGIDLAAAEAQRELEAKHGAAEAARIERGVSQVARLWRAEDGAPAAFKAFVVAEFTPEGDALDGVFRRFEFALERVNGYFTSLVRDLRQGVDLDLWPLTSLDRRLAAWNPASHATDDMFETKLAFVALLNFPLTTLDERMAKGMDWSRREWAETRLAQGFATRVPAEVQAKLTAAYSSADAYILTSA